MDVLLKRFEQPDEVRNFPQGRFELVHAGAADYARGKDAG